MSDVKVFPASARFWVELSGAERAMITQALGQSMSQLSTAAGAEGDDDARRVLGETFARYSDLRARLLAAEPAQAHEAMNGTARFIGGDADAYPGVQVGGVWVNVYVNSDGRLVISADFDESELGVGADDVTPVVVRMSGATVWSAP